MTLRSGSHARYDIKYHFVWCPKYRKMILSGNIGNYVAKIIREIAERYEFEVLELAVMPDHVHLFVGATPHVSAAELIGAIKSITAKKIFERFPSVKGKLWGGNLWERGYFVMSSGTGTTDEMIHRYIREQRQDLAYDAPNLFGAKKPPGSARG